MSIDQVRALVGIQVPPMDIDKEYQLSDSDWSKLHEHRLRWWTAASLLAMSTPLNGDPAEARTYYMLADLLDLIGDHRNPVPPRPMLAC